MKYNHKIVIFFSSCNIQNESAKDRGEDLIQNRNRDQIEDDATGLVPNYVMDLTAGTQDYLTNLLQA
ncbi:MAG: hypothetical protein ACJ71P_12395 [Nitrososphaeraceae archaeon]